MRYNTKMKDLLLIPTLLLFIGACYYDDPATVAEERACAEYMQRVAHNAGERVPTTSDARQACKEFIEENPYTKPWEAEGGH